MSEMRVIARLDARGAEKVAADEQRRLVPGEGVEPTHPFGYQILSLARLPVPPSGPQGREYKARTPEPLALGSPCGGTHNAVDEVLPELRRAGRDAHPGGRPPASRRLHRMRNDPLSQPQVDRRLRSRAWTPPPASATRRRWPGSRSATSAPSCTCCTPSRCT